VWDHHEEYGLKHWQRGDNGQYALKDSRDNEGKLRLGVLDIQLPYCDKHLQQTRRLNSYLAGQKAIVTVVALLAAAVFLFTVALGWAADATDTRTYGFRLCVTPLIAGVVTWWGLAFASAGINAALSKLPAFKNLPIASGGGSGVGIEVRHGSKDAKGAMARVRYFLLLDFMNKQAATRFMEANPTASARKKREDRPETKVVDRPEAERDATQAPIVTKQEVQPETRVVDGPEAERDVTKSFAALRHRDVSVRKSAAKELGEIGDSRAVEPLMAVLRGNDGSVVTEAVRALGKIGAPAVEPLLAALTDADSSVRERAARALYNSRRREPRAVEPLLVALKDANRSVRFWATGALGEVGDARAVNPLTVVMLKDKDKGLRARAAEALGKIGDARAAKSLSAALKDDDEGVRTRAARALKKLRARPDEAQARIKVGKKQTGMNLLQLYFSPRGRIGRRTFLLKGVLVWLASAWVAFGLALVLIGRPETADYATVGYVGLLILFPYVWVMLVTKRLHDINFSGWYQLTILFPVLYLIYVIMCCVMKEKPEAIRFGETAY
jgi:uncharacterized membrane protein YhaH (DUF805 family)